MMKYTVNLINDDGCLFDTDEFDNKAVAKSWATGHGTNYKAVLVLNETNEILKEWRPR